MTVMGLIYNGVGFSVVLTGQNLSTLTRCKIILGVVLLAMIFADVFHRVVGISVFGQIYDAIFFLVGGGYTAKIIYGYSKHSKPASALTKWRMRFSKWGAICCLLTLLDMFMPDDVWVIVHPSLVLLDIAWVSFALSTSIPSWLSPYLIAIEIAPRLFNDALFMWRYVVDRYQPIIDLKRELFEAERIASNNVWKRIDQRFKPPRKLLHEALFLLGSVIDCYSQIVNTETEQIEKWVEQWEKRLDLSQEQTEALIRATYLNLAWCWISRRKHQIRIVEDSQLAISEQVLIREKSDEYMREIRCWQDAAKILRHTTEWWDGTGEPNQLLGKSIPIESRILAIVEVFVTKQKAVNDTDAAIAHIRAGAGTQFDPWLVDALEKMAQESWRF
ncbi:hypothetical protein IH992_23550 [Candidatus Poribacteria bacterium]|nr:hypothetical protein [Candidatus Poribacteria bacterium]